MYDGAVAGRTDTPVQYVSETEAPHMKLRDSSVLFSISRHTLIYDAVEIQQKGMSF